MRISDWSSDVCSSDLLLAGICGRIDGAVALDHVQKAGVMLGFVRIMPLDSAEFRHVVLDGNQHIVDVGVEVLVTLCADPGTMFIPLRMEARQGDILGDRKSDVSRRSVKVREKNG